jgi:hypothetical protein
MLESTFLFKPILIHLFPVVYASLPTYTINGPVRAAAGSKFATSFRGRQDRRNSRTTRLLILHRREYCTIVTTTEYCTAKVQKSVSKQEGSLTPILAVTTRNCHVFFYMPETRWFSEQEDSLL